MLLYVFWIITCIILVYSIYSWTGGAWNLANKIEFNQQQHHPKKKMVQMKIVWVPSLNII